MISNEKMSQTGTVESIRNSIARIAELGYPVYFLGIQEVPTLLTQRGKWFNGLLRKIHGNSDDLKSMGKHGAKVLDLWTPTAVADLVELDQPGRGTLIVESADFVERVIPKFNHFLRLVATNVM
jgi:hypothetical protein